MGSVCMKKCTPNERIEINKAFNKLKHMIEVEEQYGRPFEKIFNNETLKYDVLGNDFYTFKAHGKDRTQIRLLYKFVRLDDNTFDIELHAVHIKRNTDTKYIKEFREYVKKKGKEKKCI